MERGNRRHSSTFVESTKVKRRERQSGANCDDEMDSKPLIRQLLLKDDPRVTPDQKPTQSLIHRANTDLRRRSDVPSHRRQRYSSSEDCLKKRGLTFPSSPNRLTPSSRQGQHSRLYKVIVVGEVNTGKSAIVRRYVHNFFSNKGDYRATLGVDFNLKLIHYNDELEIRLQLWDIAGQERFCNMTRAYYKGAVGAFIVFDSSNAKTFEAVDRWKRDLDSKCTTPSGQSIPAILICNKTDLSRDPRLPDDEEISRYVRDEGFVEQWFKTSAKTGEGIQDAMNQMVHYIMSMDTWSWPLHSSMEADLDSDLSTISLPASSSASKNPLEDPLLAGSRRGGQKQGLRCYC